VPRGGAGFLIKENSEARKSSTDNFQLLNGKIPIKNTPHCSMFYLFIYLAFISRFYNQNKQSAILIKLGESANFKIIKLPWFSKQTLPEIST
jgi:hypothetical protein